MSIYHRYYGNDGLGQILGNAVHSQIISCHIFQCYEKLWGQSDCPTSGVIQCWPGRYGHAACGCPVIGLLCWHQRLAILHDLLDNSFSVLTDLSLIRWIHGMCSMCYWSGDHLVLTVGGEPMLSTVIVEVSQEARLFNWVELFLGRWSWKWSSSSKSFSMIKTSQQSRWLITKVVRSLLPRLFIQADTQISRLKTPVYATWLVISWHLDLTQGHPGW